MTTLPKEIETALGALPEALAALGYRPVAGQLAESFGDFFVRFTNGRSSFALTRDRSQFMVRGEPDELEPAGLWRAFDDIAELEAPLLGWLQERREQ